MNLGLNTARKWVVVGLTSVAVMNAPGQDEWTWPEKPENLQVLDKDWPGSRLRPVMSGFTSALGVGCSHCHVGTPGKPLTTYDFVSDANPNKDRAREMLRMLASVNDHLKKIKPSGDKPVNMWCHTCHAGRPRPITLREELGEQYRIRGIEAALQRYDDLKQKFFGRGGYDFGEQSLNGFGYEILRNNDPAGAIRIFALNTELFPESSNTWDSLGEAYLSAGNTDRSAECYEKAVSLDPQNENAKQQLMEIRQTKEQ